MNILRTQPNLAGTTPTFQCVLDGWPGAQGHRKSSNPPYLSGRYIAAELSAIKWLLEEQMFVATTKPALACSFTFLLRTRWIWSKDFAICTSRTLCETSCTRGFMAVKSALTKTEPGPLRDARKRSNAINATPIRTSISVQGVGEVEAHGPCRRNVRTAICSSLHAWRELIKQAETAREIYFVDRHPVFDVQHRNPGKHYAAQGGQIFVITPPNADSPMPRLVTVTKPSSLPATSSLNVSSAKRHVPLHSPEGGQTRL